MRVVRAWELLGLSVFWVCLLIGVCESVGLCDNALALMLACGMCLFDCV